MLRYEVNDLCSAAVRNELDLTDEQLRSVERRRTTLARLKAAIQQLIVARSNPEDGDAIPPLERRIAAEREAFLDASQESLLPAQLRQLEQLRRRRSVLESGLERALFGGDFREVRLDDEEVERTSKAFVKLRAESAEALQGEVTRAVKEGLSVLSKRQLEQMDELVGSLPQYAVPCREHLLTQLRQVSTTDIKVVDNVDELLCTWPAYYLSLDGELVALPQEPISFAEFVRLCTSKAYGDLEMIGDQVARANGKDEAVAIESSKLRSRLGELKRDRLAGRVSYDDGAVLAERLIREHERWRVAFLLDGLLPHQRAELDRFVFRRLIATRGIHACLVNGVLGQRLGISKVQKDQIEAIARRRAEALAPILAQQERTVWREIGACLGEEEHAKLKDEVGEVSQHLSGCPDLLLRKSTAE